MQSPYLIHEPNTASFDLVPTAALPCRTRRNHYRRLEPTAAAFPRFRNQHLPSKIVHSTVLFIQVGNGQTNRSLEGIATEGSISKYFRPLWLSIPIRSKREDQGEQLPTRHAKHRKRRRCRNRATCFREFQENATTEDREAANTVPKAEDPREQNIQVIYPWTLTFCGYLVIFVTRLIACLNRNRTTKPGRKLTDRRETRRTLIRTTCRPPN